MKSIPIMQHLSPNSCSLIDRQCFNYTLICMEFDFTTSLKVVLHLLVPLPETFICHLSWFLYFWRLCFCFSIGLLLLVVGVASHCFVLPFFFFSWKWYSLLITIFFFGGSKVNVSNFYKCQYQGKTFITIFFKLSVVDWLWTCDLNWRTHIGFLFQWLSTLP